jgi:hypothetical protein
MREVEEVVEPTSLYTVEKAVHKDDADNEAEVADYTSAFVEGGKDIGGLSADTDFSHLPTLGFCSETNLGFGSEPSNIAGSEDPFASEPTWRTPDVFGFGFGTGGSTELEWARGTVWPSEKTDNVHGVANSAGAELLNVDDYLLTSTFETTSYMSNPSLTADTLAFNPSSTSYDTSSHEYNGQTLFPPLDASPTHSSIGSFEHKVKTP